MINSTQVLYFTLSAYFDTGLLKYLYFIITISLYVFIVGANVLLIVVICTNRSLHEPMYLFLCSLFVNELYGSTALFPLLLVQILSDIHTVSAPLCFVQIYCVHTYVGIEYINLAVMSYDRYLAICRPLQYHSHMTYNKIATLIAFTWLYPLLLALITAYLRSSLQLCGVIIHKAYCDSHSIVKLACYETKSIYIYSLIIMFCTLVIPLILIFFTYLKILKVCFNGSKQTRQKCVSTCSPHIASILNLTLGITVEVIQNRFQMNNVPNIFKIFLSVYFLTCPPIFNPLMYGLNLSKIRVTCNFLISNGRNNSEQLST